jgi:hypothetical protein
MRRIRNAVFLGDLRCDGSSHGGCQKGCKLFWKEAWLKELKPEERNAPEPDDSIPKMYPFPMRLPAGGYICQSTELLNATTAMPPWDLASYIRDIRARTYSVWTLVRILLHASYLRLRRLLTGASYRVLQGTHEVTPTENLNLRPGEWVVVKSKAEVAATLDRNGKNHGLAFTVEMLPFCGKSFRVLRRLECIILETTRESIEVKNTVLLEGVTCDGCHIMRGGCPRENFHFWREIWLRREAMNDAP